MRVNNSRGKGPIYICSIVSKIDPYSNVMPWISVVYRSGLQSVGGEKLLTDSRNSLKIAVLSVNLLKVYDLVFVLFKPFFLILPPKGNQQNTDSSPLRQCAFPINTAIYVYLFFSLERNIAYIYDQITNTRCIC